MNNLVLKRIKKMAIAVLATMFVGCFGLAFKMLPNKAYANGNPEMTIQVSQETAKAGETVQVKINLVNNPGVASLKLNVAYEDFLTLENIEYNSSLGGQATSSNYIQDGSPATLIWVNAFENFTNDGVFATLTFKIDDDAAEDSFSEISVSYNPADIYNVDETDIDLNVINGYVYITSCVAGDINGDGNVNNKDITRLFQYLANWNVTVNEDALDVNGDGSINNKDITRLFQYLANWDVKIYVRKPCIVTFNGNGGTLVSGKTSQAIKKGGSAIAPVYEREGYTFEGFDIDYTNVTKDLIVTAQWKENDKKLETPVISKIEYDTIYWSPVDDADYYTVRVNDNYECELRGSSCSLSDVKWNGNAISNYGYVSVKIMANENGGYASSDWSGTNTSYYYVPENHSKAFINTAKEYGVSFGYNFIEDANLSATNIKNSNSILNIYKIATVAQEINRTKISRSTTGGYYYSSIDDFMAKMSFDLKYGVNNSLSLPFSGDLKTELDLAFGVSTTLKTHKYSSTYIGQIEAEGYSYSFDQLNLADLQYCLSDTFKKEIGRNTDATRNLTMEELCEYIYMNYGTHVILGVKTGGLLISQYNVCTNSEQIATDVNFAFALSFGSGIQNLVSTNFNFDLSLQEQIENKTEQTQTSFHTYSRGGTKAFTTKLTDYSATSQSWTVDDSNAEATGVTENGALAISSLLYFIDPTLSAAFETYINGKADAIYHELFDQYTMPTTLPMSVNVENGQNVLRVDLSSYQSAGTLGDAYSPNLLNNVLTVYPVMFGKDIDKIVVIGAFDETKTLIDNFSIELSSQWKRNIEIEFENCGFVCASENGLVDDSKVTKNINIDISYKGINFVADKQGNNILRASINDREYDFVFDIGQGVSLDLSTIRISAGDLALADAIKANYTFIGWYDSNSVQVTDDLSNVFDSYALTDTVVLHAVFTPVKYEITLNNQYAYIGGTQVIYERYEDDLYANEDCTSEIEYIVIPQKTGYVFNGYYESVENNSSPNAVGTKKRIDENGNFVNFGSTTFDSKKTLYALWKPAMFTITLDNGEGIDNTTITSTYNVGLSESYVSVPVKDGYTFLGYYVSVSDNNTEQAVGTTKVINENGKILFTSTDVTGNVTYYALWVENGLTFELNENHTAYTVTAYGGSATNVYIPAVYKGLPVTIIGGYAFKNKTEITNIEIPDSIERVDYNAFFGCDNLTYYENDNIYYLGNSENNYIILIKENNTLITTCSINDTVKIICYSAFEDCTNLNNITISNSVTSIGHRAFYDCSSLTSVIFAENSQLISIGNYAFYDCRSLTNITIPNSVTSIGGAAFCGCSRLTSISIPDSLTSIGAWAFGGCWGLISVTIPDSVTSIGEAAFTNCSKFNINYLGDINQWVVIKGLGSLQSKNLYINGTTPKEIVLNSNTLEPYAFSSCKDLTKVVICNGVQSIGDRAFYGCSSLTSITIPDSVTSIGSGAFYNCSSLTSITIPDSVTSIGSSAFSGCSSLQEITIPFVGGSKSATSASDSTLFGYIFGTNSYAGGTETDQRGVIGGLNVYYIPSSLTKVTVTGGSILTSAFINCAGLTSITIGNNVTCIGFDAFYQCTGLTSITIPDSVTIIGTGAFGKCSNLTTVIIPNSITSIESQAFYKCTGLTSIYYNGTKEQWQEINKGVGFKTDVPTSCVVHCNDGDLTI